MIGRILLGFALGTAIGVLAPRWETGVGSGSDGGGDYYYGYLKVWTVRAAAQIDYWPERLPR